MILIKKQSVFQSLMVALIGVSIFNVLPVVYESTSNFSFLLVFVFTVFFLLKSFLPSKNYKNAIQTNLLYIVLLVWTVFISFRGLSTDYNFLRSLAISPYVFLPYLLPFTVKHFSFFDFKKLLNFIFYINIIYLVFVFLYLLQTNNVIYGSTGFVEDANKYLAFPNFLMLFSFSKLTKKEKLVSITVFIIGLFMAIIAARRSLLWTFAWAGVLFFYLNYVSGNKNVFKKLKLIFLLIATCVTLFFIYQKYNQVIFGNLLDRIDVDSRSTVLNDFENDMELESLIFGRGIGGTYELRETNFEHFGNMTNRNIIEAGYLNLILKGGYVYLLLLSIIYLRTMYLGFFKSKNNYAKFFAAFVFLHVVEAYPAGVLTFNVRFFLIWFCIAMVWNKKFRQFTDSKLEMSLNNNKG